MITNGLKRENLQIIPFNTNIMLLGREKDYGVVIDSDIINSMKEKTLNGGNANEHMISLEEGGKSLMELFMMKKDEGSTIVMSMVDGHMDGFQYCGRLTRAKTKALPNHVTKTQGIMLENSISAVIYYGYEWRYDGGGKEHTLFINKEGYIHRSCG